MNFRDFLSIELKANVSRYAGRSALDKEMDEADARGAPDPVSKVLKRASYRGTKKQRRLARERRSSHIKRQLQIR